MRGQATPLRLHCDPPQHRRPYLEHPNQQRKCLSLVGDVEKRKTRKEVHALRGAEHWGVLKPLQKQQEPRRGPPARIRPPDRSLHMHPVLGVSGLARTASQTAPRLRTSEQRLFQCSRTLGSPTAAASRHTGGRTYPLVPAGEGTPLRSLAATGRGLQPCESGLNARESAGESGATTRRG